jgi:serine/threonine protein kinase
MPLSPGSRLGVFEVISIIGRGGMGEVYRARDTRLARFVALKMLPDAAASDLEWRTRLEREARALASLNHPNIAAIYGLEESRSAETSRASGAAIVMELVDGETLADRLSRGPLSSRAAERSSTSRPPTRTNWSSQARTASSMLSGNRSARWRIRGFHPMVVMWSSPRR